MPEDQLEKLRAAYLAAFALTTLINSQVQPLTNEAFAKILDARMELERALERLFGRSL